MLLNRNIYHFNYTYYNLLNVNCESVNKIYKLVAEIQKLKKLILKMSHYERPLLTVG